MTNSVIMVSTMAQKHLVKDILGRWPSLRHVADDINKRMPKGREIDRIAVYRWTKRNSIPGEYDIALLVAASERNIPLNWKELMLSRSHHIDQSGQETSPVQAPASNPIKTFGNHESEGA
jgi:hypothetical protein